MRAPALVAAVAAVALQAVVAATAATAAVPLSAARIDEHPGRRIPTGGHYRDQLGQPFDLSSLFDGSRPVLLVPAYYSCPMLCGLVLEGTAAALPPGIGAGDAGYRVVTVSFDARDDATAAAAARQRTLASRRMAGAGGDWPFLVGDERDVRALMDAVGFRYAFDATTGNFAHAAAVVALTPDARVSAYVYGVDPPARELASALDGARRGIEAPSVVTAMLLRCYHYVPSLRRHGRAVWWSLRAGAGLTVVVLATLLLRAWRRELAGGGPR